MAAPVDLNAFCRRVETVEMTQENRVRFENEARGLFRGANLGVALSAIQAQAEVFRLLKETSPAVPPASAGAGQMPPSISNWLRDRRLNFPVRLVAGTFNQSASADKSTCTFCALAAGVDLLNKLKNGSELNPQLIDQSIRTGAEKKKNSRIKPGEFAEVDEAAKSFPEIKNPETFYAGLNEKNKGKDDYAREIEKLTAIAKAKGGLASAVFVKGMVSFMVAVDVRNAGEPRYYFYDSHVNIPGHENALLFSVNRADHLASLMTAAYPAISDIEAAIFYNSLNWTAFTV